MTPWHAVLFFVCGCLTSYFFHCFLTTKYAPSPIHKQQLKLAIGILSATENFEHREAIRNTWKPKASKNMQAWFIIGNKDCQIHPENRIDNYRCEKSNFKFQDPHHVRNNFLTNVTVPRDTELRKHGGNVVDRLNFKVMSNVLVKRIGVVSLVLNFESNITVQILEAWSGNVVAVASFSTIDRGIEVGHCTFQPVSSVILHKNYEYVVEIENFSNHGKMLGSEMNTALNDFDGAIYYQTKIKTSDIILPNMWLEVQDVSDDINNFKNAKLLDKEWKQHISDVRYRLKLEADTFQDILYVDTIDIYRNLPLKLLLFHQWLFNNSLPSFVLKTDDDCLIVLDSVLQYISELSEHNDNFVWWGNFRKQWLVQKFGKWAEFSYTADVYPEFACGSGNIVNANVHKWIAKNADHLHTYQGEDVSMGIWMAAISPVHLEDKRWQCSNSCTQDSLSIPELQPSEIKEHWKNVQLCNNLCNCNI
ncbi:UDP-GalNAc:beta-1,3-N-acetylgalactosaminyltransferase 2-like [Saccostrea echinata]|uniref:UDP-GalNAc:beta-1, 3-N-acetylgalactosaminyltransferase 2-like n=1 Tax=Saccostrea echinata TaxID=191078 RepID=UPI002A7ED787|nr:UDP-GalNAc:beta-1,3-N-acetylgalactosaminyltransferase 2-like [Saccostrea echinata]